MLNCAFPIPPSQIYVLCKSHQLCHNENYSWKNHRNDFVLYLFLAIVTLFSVEGFRQGSSHNSGVESQSKLGSASHQYEIDLPASYGRQLISEEEMDIINVRISSMVILGDLNNKS